MCVSVLCKETLDKIVKEAEPIELVIIKSAGYSCGGQYHKSYEAKK